jgi:hypothetical protein
MKIRCRYLQRTTAKTIFVFSLGLLTLVWAVGCSQNYGRINWDPDITKAFEANQVEPGYNFYQYTVGMQVYAIVGLDPKLEMQSRIWRKLARDTEDFKVAISRIWYNDYQLPEEPRGAVIMNPDGEKVGVYFSSLHIVVIKFEPGNQVMVMPDLTLIRGGGEGRKTP